MRSKCSNLEIYEINKSFIGVTFVNKSGKEGWPTVELFAPFYRFAHLFATLIHINIYQCCNLILAYPSFVSVLILFYWSFDFQFSRHFRLLVYAIKNTNGNIKHKGINRRLCYHSENGFGFQHFQVLRLFSSFQFPG